MIFTICIYPQHLLPDSTAYDMIHFPLSPSCAQGMIHECSSRFHDSISSRTCIRYDHILENSFDFSLDFKENFPHSISQIDMQ
jgi:hypothetical protein